MKFGMKFGMKFAMKLLTKLALKFAPNSDLPNFWRVVVLKAKE